MRERVNRRAEAVRGDGPAATLRPAEAGRIWGARSSTGQVVVEETRFSSARGRTGVRTESGLSVFVLGGVRGGSEVVKYRGTRPERCTR